MVAIINMTRTGEKIVIPSPQLNIQSGTKPVGRGIMIIFIPTNDR